MGLLKNQDDFIFCIIATGETDISHLNSDQERFPSKVVLSIKASIPHNPHITPQPRTVAYLEIQIHTFQKYFFLPELEILFFVMTGGD